MNGKPLIILTDSFLPEIIHRELAPYAKLVYPKNRKELEKVLPRAQALITRFSDRVDAGLLKFAPKLQVIGNFAVGTNNIDFPTCKALGIRVVNTPEVLSRSTAELALTLLLACARRLPEGEKLCRSGKFKGLKANELLGIELQNKSAVLVGRGRIGRETEKLFRAVGLKTAWITREDSDSSILKKLQTAQVLSLHFPLTPQTRHWLNKKRIATLPRDCIVINTTRGPTVDERALIQALAKRKIFGAGLDVYEYEPEIPARLRALHNVVLLPHVGSATEGARAAMASLVISGVLGVLAGKRPRNEVTF